MACQKSIQRATKNPPSDSHCSADEEEVRTVGMTLQESPKLVEEVDRHLRSASQRHKFPGVGGESRTFSK